MLLQSGPVVHPHQIPAIRVEIRLLEPMLLLLVVRAEIIMVAQVEQRLQVPGLQSIPAEMVQTEEVQIREAAAEVQPLTMLPVTMAQELPVVQEQEMEVTAEQMANREMMEQNLAEVVADGETMVHRVAPELTAGWS
jgi:hypothetical protein